MKNTGKIKKFSIEDYFSLMLFGCYAKEPFSVKDVREAVIDLHRATVYSTLNNFCKIGYFERVNSHYYRATQYAKDIMNVKGDIKP